ncbi:MAG: glycosyltransferase family 2 protein [Sphingomonadales bacterium]|nr:glycosyltransferase family 2 protein [Sphingomonadales bacterium]
MNDPNIPAAAAPVPRPDEGPVPGARWGVVATMDEPAPLAAAWVAHHLTIGASEVHVVFDRPNPEAEALLAGIPGVILRRSGDDGWERGWKQKRPARHQGRQKYNATKALADTKCDWIIHCDADEYVRLARPLDWELAKTGAGKAWLRLEVEERVWLDPAMGGDIFQGAFRTRWDMFDLMAVGLYGPERAAYLNRGVSGHVAGKPCVRAGCGHVIGVHYPISHWDATQSDLPYRSSYNATLMHFDGMTRLHYILKMLRRGSIQVKGKPVPYADSRTRQFMAAAARAGDPAALADLWWQVQGISAEEAAQLTELEVLRRPSVEIVAETRALFGDRVDLSPAAFDRALIAHEVAHLAEFAELWGFDPEPLVSSA